MSSQRTLSPQFLPDITQLWFINHKLYESLGSYMTRKKRYIFLYLSYCLPVSITSLPLCSCTSANLVLGTDTTGNILKLIAQLDTQFLQERAWLQWITKVMQRETSSCPWGDQAEHSKSICSTRKLDREASYSTGIGILAATINILLIRQIGPVGWLTWNIRQYQVTNRSCIL